MNLLRQNIVKLVGASVTVFGFYFFELGPVVPGQGFGMLALIVGLFILFMKLEK